MALFYDMLPVLLCVPMEGKRRGRAQCKEGLTDEALSYFIATIYSHSHDIYVC